MSSSASSKQPALSSRDLSALLALKPASEIARRHIEADRASQAPRFNWRAVGRASQIAPLINPKTGNDDWTTWLFLGGRGAGKTRAGAEWVKESVMNGASRIALVGATLDDVRKVMIEGESGIMSVYPDWDKPVLRWSDKELRFPNGAIASIFSAESPEALRGPQFDLAWSDELLKWGKLGDRRQGSKRREGPGDGINRMRLTWDNLQFGLRLGKRPRQIVTSTPRPVGLLKEIMQRTDTVITTDTSYANRANLAPAFFAEIIRRYEGTRFGRQELNAEILDDVPNALWTRAMLDVVRMENGKNLGGCLMAEDGAPPPDLVRVVVAVDPSGTSGSDDRDAVGIVIAGRGVDGRAYVLADWTCSLSPLGWGKRVVDAYTTWRADRIVAEANYGGAMVEAVIQAADPVVAVKLVNASRGKVQRAEPISALYEKDRVRHCKQFDDLDEELIQFTSEGYAGERSPNRGDALVWALTELMIEGGGQAWVDNLAQQLEDQKAPGRAIPPHLRQYIDYIRNTGRSPLPASMFDEDWDPIGPKVRADMLREGLILETPSGIFLTVDKPNPVSPASSRPHQKQRPSTTEGNELNDLYRETLNRQLGGTATLCKNCGKPVVGRRQTDGVAVWHPPGDCL